MKRKTAIFSVLLCCCILSSCSRENSDEQAQYHETDVLSETEKLPIEDEVLSADTAPSGMKTEASEAPEVREYATWQEAYTDYINRVGEECDWDSETLSRLRFSLIYLDDDEIPELFFITGGEASGEFVMTFWEGKLVEKHLSRLGTRYIERSGLLYTDTGHMGHYPVTITKLENGVFSVIGEGLSLFRVDEEGHYVLDEEEIPLRDYKWEDVDISEEAYDAAIDALFDREQGIWPEREYSAEEMLSVLQIGACTSAGHHYELIQADVTWAEAQTFCKEKGGYLVTITSPDERDIIAMQIAQEEMQDISFYVGYHNHEHIGEECYSARWINTDDSYTLAGDLSGFWEYSAPDYDSRQTGEWDIAQWDCGLVRYYDSTKQIYLFKAPEELLAVSSEYAGKMGYICEFDD